MKVWERNSRFFVRYDAGAHQVVMREDEITREEAKLALQGEETAMKMLLSLQQRLIRAGIDPYISNVK